MVLMAILSGPSPFPLSGSLPYCCSSGSEPPATPTYTPSIVVIVQSSSQCPLLMGNTLYSPPTLPRSDAGSCHAWGGQCCTCIDLHLILRAWHIAFVAWMNKELVIANLYTHVNGSVILCSQEVKVIQASMTNE